MDSDVLSRLSNLLVKQQLLEDDDDVDALKTAMQNLQKKQEEAPPALPVRPNKFTESTLRRMYEYDERKSSKVEEKRKEKIMKEVSCLQEKPKINPVSKKFVQNHIPLHKRLNEVVRNRNDYLKNLKLENEMRKRQYEDSVCTFKPKTSSRVNRNPAEFAEHTYTWEKRKQQEHARLLKEKQQQEAEVCTLKPQISKRSALLAQKRSTTPTFERLYQSRKTPEPPKTEQRPALNQNTLKIVDRNRTGNVHQRLYNMRKLPEPSVERPKTSRESKLSRSFNLDSTFENGYRINTSRGPVYESENNVTEVSYSPNLEFLLKSVDLNS